MGNFDSQFEVMKRSLSDFMNDSHEAKGRTIPWAERKDLVPSFRKTLESVTSLEEVVSLLLSRTTRLQSPNCFGHQVAAPEETSALFEWLNGWVNQGSGVYEIGPASNSVEKAMADILIEKVGYPKTADGFATHGGTAGILTAILAARNTVLPDSWQNGMGQDAVLITGADAHYSVARAAGIIGLGQKNVIKVAVDHKRRISPPALEKAFKEVGNRKVIAVVACSGSTAVGAFDPLEEIAAICDNYQTWLHVDGAHGASVLLSKKYRHLVKGIENSRSVVWDAHKLMSVAALCTFVLYRNGTAEANRAFSQDAPYLFDGMNTEDVNTAARTLECTRRALAVPVWGLWSVKGEKFFEDHIDKLFQTTREFYEHLKAQKDFEVLNDPESNILCFRFLPAGDKQREVRKAIIEKGDFYFTQTVVDGVPYLRTTIMNPLTELEHLKSLLNAIRSL